MLIDPRKEGRRVRRGERRVPRFVRKPWSAWGGELAIPALPRFDYKPWHPSLSQHSMSPSARLRLRARGTLMRTNRVVNAGGRFGRRGRRIVRTGGRTVAMGRLSVPKAEPSVRMGRLLVPKAEPSVPMRRLSVPKVDPSVPKVGPSAHAGGARSLPHGRFDRTATISTAPAAGLPNPPPSRFPNPRR